MNTDSETTTGTPRKRWWLIPLVIGCVALFSWGWIRFSFPYGSHRVCAKGLALDLLGYAEENNGWLPYGGKSPEGSLGLLCCVQTNGFDTNILGNLSGKNISRELSLKAWLKNGTLDSDSCGWHYVEGLRQGDDSDSGGIAMAWDKEMGLDHFGQRRRGYAREVIYLDGTSGGVSMERWPKFAMEQREKIARIIASRTNGEPPIRWSDEETLGTNWFPAPK